MKNLVLKGRIKTLGMNQADVADKIGLSASRFNAKLNNTRGAEFSLREVRALKNLLDLGADEVDDIFFS